MSETAAEAEQHDDELELGPGFVVRTFTAEIASDGDGRTIEGLVIPFDVEQTVSDPPDFQPYRESIARGAFRRAVKAPNRVNEREPDPVLLDFEHYGALTHDALGSMGSIAGTLGHATELVEQPDGLHGTFRVLNGPDGDKALELVHEKVLRGFSVAMRPLKSARIPGGFRRLLVHLDRVSLCRTGAYPESRVLAVRSATPGGEIIDLADLEQPLDPALAAGLARFVTVPGFEQQEDAS